MVRRRQSHFMLAIGLALAWLILPRAVGAASQTITFDDLANPNRVLNGQYPSGVIDWGTNAWYLSGPWQQFTTNSIGFDGAGPTSEPFTFVTPRRLLAIDAYNGGSVTSTITLSCSGQPTRTSSLPARTLITISTAWTGTCTSVTFGSTNGWNTNFDNMVIDDGNAPAITNLTATPTRNSATITWTTNIPSTTQVEYGPTATYGSLSAMDSTLVTTHSTTLTGLPQASTYHFRARSADGSGNLGMS